MTEHLQTLQSNFQLWLKDVRTQHGASANTGIKEEVQDVEALLFATKKSVFEKTLLAEERDVKELKKRLSGLGQSNLSVDSVTMKELYKLNRGIKRAKAVDVTKDYEILNTLLKEVFSFSIDAAMIQLLKMTEIMKPVPNEDILNLKNGKSKYNEEQLLKQKRNNEDFAVFQSTVAKKNLANVTKIFYDSRWLEITEKHKHTHPCLVSSADKSKALFEYVDSCLELCWFMTTSYPTMYFIWEDISDDKPHFDIDTSDDSTGVYKIVYPAIVKGQRGDKLDKYEVIVKGLKQKVTKQAHISQNGLDSKKSTEHADNADRLKDKTVSKVNVQASVHETGEKDARELEDSGTIETSQTGDRFHLPGDKNNGTTKTSQVGNRDNETNYKTTITVVKQQGSVTASDTTGKKTINQNQAQGLNF